MNKEILNNLGIRTVNKEKLSDLEIDLSKYELVDEGETPMKSIPSLKQEARDTAKKFGADLLVLSNEKIYGGMFADKYKYDYELYKSKP